MKQLRAYHLFVLLIVGMLACQRGVDIPATNNVNEEIVRPPSQVGVVTTSGDTTVVTFDSLIVRYTKTPACFPSKEVFTFTVTNKNLPQGSTYVWKFGDGNQANGAAAQYSYNRAGSFVASVEVSNNNRLIMIANFPVKAWGEQVKPEASFSVKSDFPENVNYITFNSTSSINRGTIIQYRWDWGDGNFTVSSNGLTRYEFPTNPTDRTFPVKLTITSNSGCTDDTIMNVLVPAKYPITGNFNAVAFNACTNESFVFTSTATNVPTGAVYSWNFSDGQGIKTGNPINYKYKYMNDYDVIMMIHLNGRLIYTTNKMVSAKGENPKPKAVFQETFVGQDANTVRWSFNSQSTVAHGGIDGYFWTFGNGQFNNDYYSFVETTYTKGSTTAIYPVRLIVTANGCSDTTSKSIIVPPR